MNKITITNEIDYKLATSIYDFIIKDTYHMDVPLSEYCRGYVTLIVNIGSVCPLTAPNYAQLTKINKDFDGSKNHKFRTKFQQSCYFLIKLLFLCVNQMSFHRDSDLDISMQSIFESNARRRW